MSVVNIKKAKSEPATVRAGARYMINNFNLKYLGFLSESSEKQLIEMIDFAKLNLHDIKTRKFTEKNKRTEKQTYGHSIFSLSDLMKKGDMKPQI
ncbi:MAG: hypothetical protein HRU26_11620 [Psychroserpens sp.]|nr:hypothetical protein [Psychroserpens sp.]